MASLSCSCVVAIYCIEGKFEGGKVCWIDSFQAFGEKKFGKLIDQAIGYKL